MKKQRKQYDRPKRPWDKERIESEKVILNTYGLRRKSEIWRAEGILRNYRRIARQLAASKDKEKEKIIINKVHNLGLIQANSTLDDILALKVDDLLNRRLQTIVNRKGLANTLKQSRQYIVHGHIALNGVRNRWPSTLVRIDEEASIAFYPRSKVKETLLKSAVAAKKADAPKVEKKVEPKAIAPKENTTGETNAGQ